MRKYILVFIVIVAFVRGSAIDPNGDGAGLDPHGRPVVADIGPGIDPNGRPV